MVGGQCRVGVRVDGRALHRRPGGRRRHRQHERFHGRARVDGGARAGLAREHLARRERHRGRGGRVLAPGAPARQRLREPARRRARRLGFRVAVQPRGVRRLRQQLLLPSPRRRRGAAEAPVPGPRRQLLHRRDTAGVRRDAGAGVPVPQRQQPAGRHPARARQPHDPQGAVHRLLQRVRRRRPAGARPAAQPHGAGHLQLRPHWPHPGGARRALLPRQALPPHQPDLRRHPAGDRQPHVAHRAGPLQQCAHRRGPALPRVARLAPAAQPVPQPPPRAGP
uniref:Uncharacterized protein n=1 Tax=Arundo donax TaxID=35708 RepID=A0A0A9CSP9_ARUDO